MLNDFRKVNEFTRANSCHDRLWRFYGDRKTVALGAQSVYSGPRPNGTRPREGAAKRKGAIMYVTVNRQAIESALLAVPPFINRSN